MIGALPAGIVQGLFPQGQMQTAAEPFVYGAGGRRMTPQDIARERDIAASLTQLDFSPVQSPWQGLARVAGNAVGALRERKADQASQSNADYSAQIAQSLLNPSGTPSASAPLGAASSSTPGGNSLMDTGRIAQMVLADPYIDANTKALAQRQLGMADFEQKQKLQAQYAEPTPEERLAKVAFPNDPARQLAFLQKVAQTKEDPFTSVIGNDSFGSYAGPQSGLSAIIGAQGQPAPAAPAPGTVVADPRKQGGQAATPPATFR